MLFVKIIGAPHPFGSNHIHLTEIDSTNKYTMQLLRQNVIEHGTVVTADYQTQGVGRNQAHWQSGPTKNLLFSILVDPKALRVTDQFLISMLSAVAVFSALNQMGIQAEIKWPNDVLVDNQKIAGILIQNTVKGAFVDKSIIGIGLNVSEAPNLETYAATCIQAYNPAINREEVLSILVQKMAYYFQLFQQNTATIKKLYLNALLGFNDWIQLKKDNHWLPFTIVDVQNSGELVGRFKNDAATYKFQLDEVKLRYNAPPTAEPND